MSFVRRLDGNRPIAPLRLPTIAARTLANIRLANACGHRLRWSKFDLDGHRIWFDALCPAPRPLQGAQLELSFRPGLSGRPWTGCLRIPKDAAAPALISARGAAWHAMSAGVRTSWIKARWPVIVDIISLVIGEPVELLAVDVMESRQAAVSRGTAAAEMSLELCDQAGRTPLWLGLYALSAHGRPTNDIDGKSPVLPSRPTPIRPEELATAAAGMMSSGAPAPDMPVRLAIVARGRPIDRRTLDAVRPGQVIVAETGSIGGSWTDLADRGRFDVRLGRTTVFQGVFVNDAGPGRPGLKIAAVVFQSRKDGQMNDVEPSRPARTSPRPGLSDDGQTPADAPASAIDDLPLGVEFELGRVDARLGDLATIGPGHVFETGIDSANLEVRILVDGQPAGRGRLVAIDSLLGIEVTRWYPAAGRDMGPSAEAGLGTNDRDTPA